MKYKLEKASPENESQLILLSRNVINHNFRQFMQDEMVDEYINSQMADKEIIDNIKNTDILIHDNNIVGLCIWKDNLLHLLMVSPDFQGSGVAKYFLDELCNEKFCQYSELQLECFENNNRAIKFYKKCGWTIYKTEVDVMTGLNRLYFKKLRVIS